MDEVIESVKKVDEVQGRKRRRRFRRTRRKTGRRRWRGWRRRGGVEDEVKRRRTTRPLKDLLVLLQLLRPQSFSTTDNVVDCTAAIRATAANIS